MIGFHMQASVPDWPRAVAQLPAGTWFKTVDNVQALSQAKAVNPGIKTVLRHWYDPDQVFGGTLEENKQRARAFFATFIDGTFMQHAANVDAVEEWNEYHAESHTPDEIQQRVIWARAVAEVWYQEYRTYAALSHIRLVLANTAVGNTIPFEYGAIANENDCIMGYHAYVPVNRNLYTTDGFIKPGEWPHYSGRWQAMDEAWRRRDIYVPWLFTEFGAVGEEAGHLRPNDGWRMAYTYNGNIDEYLGMMGYWLDNAMMTNAHRYGRVLGATIFTSGGGSQWQQFELRQPHMDDVARYVNDFEIPSPPPPPPPPSGLPLATRQALWVASVDEQVQRGIPLNPHAALQAAIFAAGMVPVHREIAADGYVIQAAESLDGSKARRVYYWRDNGHVAGWFIRP